MWTRLFSSTHCHVSCPQYSTVAYHTDVLITIPLFAKTRQMACSSVALVHAGADGKFKTIKTQPVTSADGKVETAAKVCVVCACLRRAPVCALPLTCCCVPLPCCAAACLC